MTELLVLSLGDASPAGLTAWRWGSSRPTRPTELAEPDPLPVTRALPRRARAELREAVC